MNVLASESIGESWATLEGHVINDVFPLRRHLGGSDHSGVFLTELAGREPAEVALKLVPATSTLADWQLSRWLISSGLDHPHLLRLLEAGRCRVDEVPHLYGVMEYADQTLAQLLKHRAMTEDEAREMLAPTLQALAFLHGRGLVHGQLKPSNILVVGDGLKLSSDTIRPVGEVGDSTNPMSVYDPPEARDGRWSGAGDIWALGVTLCEALTRRRPSGLRDGAGSVGLPADLSPVFREVVARCLSHSTHDRPSVADIEAWLGGQPLAPAPAADLHAEATVELLELSVAQTIAYEHEAPAPPPPPVSTVASKPNEPPPPVSTIASKPTKPVPAVSAIVPPQPAQSVPPVSRITVQAFEPVTVVSGKAASPGDSAGRPLNLPAFPLVIGAVILVVLGWAGVRMVGNDSAENSPAAAGVTTPAVVEAARDDGGAESAAESEAFDTPPTSTPAPKTSRNAMPVIRSQPPPLASGADAAAASPSEVHEEIPDVPQRARQTIRGTVRVSVRVIVSPDGTVFAALTDTSGPSRYFERLAIEAAKKWTFAPMDTEEQRLMQVRFSFTRDGTTARAETLQ